MLYPWYSYIGLGVALAATFFLAIYVPIGWRRNLYIFLPIGILFFSMVVMMASLGHAIRGNAGILTPGYSGLPGIMPEIEIFGLGMFASYAVYLAFFVCTRVWRRMS